MLDPEYLQAQIPAWSKAITARLLRYLYFADPHTLEAAMDKFPDELEIQLGMFVENMEKIGVFDPPPVTEVPDHAVPLRVGTAHVEPPALGLPGL